MLFSLSKALVSSSRNVAGSTRCTLSRFNVSRPSEGDLFFFVKPPLVGAFVRRCKFAGRETLRTIGGCERHCGGVNVFRYSLFPKMGRYVRTLGTTKCEVKLTSSGPRGSYRHVLRRFKVLSVFSRIIKTAFSNEVSAGRRILGRIVHQ